MYLSKICYSLMPWTLRRCSEGLANGLAAIAFGNAFIGKAFLIPWSAVGGHEQL